MHMIVMPKVDDAVLRNGAVGVRKIVCSVKKFDRLQIDRKKSSDEKFDKFRSIDLFLPFLRQILHSGAWNLDVRPGGNIFSRNLR